MTIYRQKSFLGVFQRKPIRINPTTPEGNSTRIILEYGDGVNEKGVSTGGCPTLIVTLNGEDTIHVRRIKVTSDQNGHSHEESSETSYTGEKINEANIHGNEGNSFGDTQIYWEPTRRATER